jgi:FAD:protein FMN transferase
LGARYRRLHWGHVAWKFGGVWLLFALLLVGCSDGPPETRTQEALQHLQGKAFGTTWSVKWIGAADPKVEGAIIAALEAVDAGMSTWRDDSELMRVRRGPGPVAVGEDTHFVVREALALAETTGGAFDPTVQPLMAFWGFLGEPRASWPTSAQLGAVREQVGYAKVTLGEPEAGSFTIDAGGTSLDLSAIAKGHAVDRVSMVLSDLGYRQHFVEIGGEVRGRGAGPSGDGWVVGVDQPVSGSTPGAHFAALFRLRDRSMATSGNYRNRVKVGDKPIGHTLDPRTGLPVDTKVKSVTVLAPDCRTADALATALMVLGPDEGLRLIEATEEVEAMILVETSAGQRERVSSSLSLHRLNR